MFLTSWGFPRWSRKTRNIGLTNQITSRTCHYEVVPFTAWEVSFIPLDVIIPDVIIPVRHNWSMSSVRCLALFEE